MLRPRTLLAALAASGALLVPVAVAPSAASAASKERLCSESIRFSGTTTRLVVLRPTSCRTARKVARAFDRAGTGGSGASGYGCFFAKAPFETKFGRKVGFSCRKGGASGTTRIWGLLPKGR